MTAEVEALLERLDKAGVSPVPSVLVVREAAALIRSQEGEIYKWKELDRVTQSAFERELKRAEAAEAKLAAAARQEPVAWFQKNEDGLYEQVGHQYAGDTGTVPLYAAPVPAGDAVSEEDTEALRMIHIMLKAPVGECCLTRSVIDGRLCMAAIGTIEPVIPAGNADAMAAVLWVLWHHQGGSSPIGQPLRKFLRIMEYDDMTNDQVAIAKEFATRFAAADAKPK